MACFGKNVIDIHLNPQISLFACLFGGQNTGLDQDFLRQVRHLSKEIRERIYYTSDNTLLPKWDSVIEKIICCKELKTDNRNYSKEFFALVPAYQKVWKHNIRNLQSIENKVLKDYKKYTINRWLFRIKNFYDTPFNKKNPPFFDVFLFPCLDERAIAFPIGSHTLCLQELPKHNGIQHIGVIVHEVCHIFYEQKSQHQNKMFKKFFTRHHSAFSELAENYLDEALATCIGNRFIVGLAGRPSKEGAYDEWYINTYSEKLLPLVKEYLCAHKVLDCVFLEKAIEIFKKTFPQAPSDYKMLFFAPEIFSDFSENDIIKKVLSVFFSTRIHVYPVCTGGSSKIFNEKFANFFIVKNSHNIPGITLKNTSDTLYIKKKNDRLFIIIQTNSLEKVEKALVFLKKQGEFSKTLLYKL